MGLHKDLVDVTEIHVPAASEGLQLSFIGLNLLQFSMEGINLGMQQCCFSA